MMPSGIAPSPSVTSTGTICLTMPRRMGSILSSYPSDGSRCNNGRVQEAHLELTSLRCPRCAGQLVLRVLAEERGRSVSLTLDSACIACGVSPWAAPDQRSVVFTPGAPIGDPAAPIPDAEERVAAAQARI